MGCPYGPNLTRQHYDSCVEMVACLGLKRRVLLVLRMLVSMMTGDVKTFAILECLEQSHYGMGFGKGILK